MTRLRFLAISGSLRARSTNAELLRAAALLAPPTVAVTLYDGLAELPHFDPDRDEEGATPAPSVARLRECVAAADALLISSPEYAHGVPGSLKNALDWLVSDPRMPEKPIALLNASARSVHAHAALVEILRTMATRLVPEGGMVVPLDARRLDAAAIAADPTLAGLVRDALDALVAAARARRRAVVSL